MADEAAVWRGAVGERRDLLPALAAGISDPLAQDRGRSVRAIC
jgi:hypothetical protein